LKFPEWNARREQVTDAESGTNEWVWKHPAYQNWEEAESGILLIEGKPGSGNSTLARSILKNLTRSIQRQDTDSSYKSDGKSKGTTVPFISSTVPLVSDWFYSVRLGSKGMSQRFLLRSLLYQLLRQRSSLFDFFLHVYRLKPISTDIDFEQDWSEEETMNVLKDIMPTGLSMVFIIDAVDESEDANVAKDRDFLEQGTEQGTILSTLSKVAVATPQSRVKFLMLSRPHPFIELDFARLHHKSRNTFKIVLEKENRGDIDRIIERGLISL
jgi:hypothetical protein